MRPATPVDAEAVTALWRQEVRRGVRDAIPAGAWLDGLLRGLDWEARSRVVEKDGRVVAALLVLDRRVVGGTIARLEFAGDRRHQAELIGWGARLAHAAGATKAQVWRGRGDADGLVELGLRPVRPFWRMDRDDLQEVPALAPGLGYRVVSDDDDEPPAATWVATYNLAFAEHWQHQPKEVEEFVARRSRPDRVPGLQALALAPDGVPAAVVIASLETYPDDRRRQPVGVVAIVGTVPGHRRRGLASALLARVLDRLRAAGARSASLYVDGANPTGAADVYRRLGFEVAYEFEVWEVAFAT